MFGLHTLPDAPNRRGGWGDERPFRVPVLALAHLQRPPVETAGGARFEFLSASPLVAFARAGDAAGGKDVRIGVGKAFDQCLVQPAGGGNKGRHVAGAGSPAGRGRCE